MSIALLRNKQLLALLILALVTVLIISFIVASTVFHVNLIHSVVGFSNPH